MYPSEFTLVRPDSLAAAVDVRADLGPESAIYAGGTELVLAMKMGMLNYRTLVDIKRVPELGNISLDDGFVSIGATVTHHKLAHDPLIAEMLPALGELARRIANVRVRVAGTLAGNLAFAEPHADPPALLAALNAQVELADTRGSRRVGIQDFLLGAYETDLADTEIVTSILVPLPATDTIVRYDRFRIGERPAVTVAVAARVVGGYFAEPPAVVIGAVDEIPVRPVTDDVAGARINDLDAIRLLAEQVPDVIDPVDDAHGTGEYKRHLSQVLARRVLTSISAPGKEGHTAHA